MSGTPYCVITGRIASVWGVPRFMNRASTFFCLISASAFAPDSFGSNLSSMTTNSIFSPCTPPLALTASMYSLAPAADSRAEDAMGPVTPVVWPIRSSARAGRDKEAQVRAARRRWRKGMRWKAVRDGCGPGAAICRDERGAESSDGNHAVRHPSCSIWCGATSRPAPLRRAGFFTPSAGSAGCRSPAAPAAPARTGPAPGPGRTPGSSSGGWRRSGSR
jgi:hypothetical protein